MSESFPTAEVSIFSSLCRGQLPLSQHMITKALRWNTTCCRDTGPVTDLTVALRSMPLWCKSSASCLQAKACFSPSRGRRSKAVWFLADLPCAGETTGQCQSHHKVLPTHGVYLGKDVSANKILRLARYTKGVDGAGKWTHLVQRVKTDFRVYILLKTYLTLTWLTSWHMKCGIWFCGKSTLNSKLQVWKILFVFIASSKILAWLKPMCLGLFSCLTVKQLMSKDIFKKTWSSLESCVYRSKRPLFIYYFDSQMCLTENKLCI